MNHDIYMRLSLIMRYLLSAVGVSIALWALFTAFRDLRRAAARRSREARLSAVAVLHVTAVDGRGKEDKLPLGRSGSVGSGRGCDARIKNMGLPELLFDYDIEDMQMHIYPANPAYLRLDKGDEGDVTQDVLTVEKGQRIFAGRAVLCFKPLAPAGKFLSPMARRAYRKGARHEN